VVAKETVRQPQIASGLWIPRKLRPPRIHQPRARRACLGELIQIDGCEHRWFIERYGKPLAFYSDKASVFRTNNVASIKGPGHTQFGRDHATCARRT